MSILAVSGSQGARLAAHPVRPGRAARRYIARPEGRRGRESCTPYFVHKCIEPSIASLRPYSKQQLLILAMTSWFIGVKASVISGAPLYSKSISSLFPVGKRQVLFAKRSYIEKFGFEPVARQQKSGRHPPVAFLFYGGPSGVQPAPQAAAAALRALRAALANAHAFAQLRALSGSNPCRGNKKAAGISQSLSFLWWAVRGSNPGPWD